MLVSASFSLLHFLSKVPKFFLASPSLPPPYWHRRVKLGRSPEMKDIGRHQLELGKREELGGAARQRGTLSPQAPPRGGRPGPNGTGRGARLGGPVVGHPCSPLRGGAGSAGTSSLIPLRAEPPLSPAPPPPFPNPRSGAAHAAAPCSVPPSHRAGTGPCSPQPMAGQ